MSLKDPSYSNLEKWLIKRAGQIAKEDISSNPSEFGGMIRSIILGDKAHTPTPVAKHQTRKEKVESELFMQIIEIRKSLDRLGLLGKIINRKPPKPSQINNVEYLKFCIESYLNEVYVFKERIVKLVSICERECRNLKLSEEVDTLKHLKKDIVKDLGNVIGLRDSHVHDRRFKDRNLGRLNTLDLLCNFDCESPEKEIFQQHLSTTYQIVRSKWKITIRNSFEALEKLNITVEDDILYKIVIEKVLSKLANEPMR